MFDDIWGERRGTLSETVVPFARAGFSSAELRRDSWQVHHRQDTYRRSSGRVTGSTEVMRRGDANQLERIYEIGSNSAKLLAWSAA